MFRDETHVGIKRLFLHDLFEAIVGFLMVSNHAFAEFAQAGLPAFCFASSRAALLHAAADGILRKFEVFFSELAALAFGFGGEKRAGTQLSAADSIMTCY